MGKIRMGVIGTAGISRVHIDGILQSNDAELTALCDVNEGALKSAGVKYGIESKYLFTDYKRLIECLEVDAVSICTPNDSHFEIALEAVRNKKPFALEKPVTLTYQEAVELKKAVKEANIPNMVCFSYRFKAAARFARWIISQGHLGRIYHVYGQYLQSWGINEEVPLVWRFKKDISGSGALGDLGSHMLDLTRFIVGDFKKVCGHAGTYITERKIPGTNEPGKVDVDDFCHFMAELDGGISAAFAISRFAYGRGNYQRVEVYGTKGGLVYSLEDEETIEICVGELYSNAKEYHRIPVPEKFKSNQMQSFFDIINGKGDSLAATIDDGCINQYLLDGIIKSFTNNEWVTINGG
jgi:predicted dehydrogenase